MKIDKILLYVISLIVLGLLVWTINVYAHRRDIAYVDIAKLAENYKLKKDMEKVSTSNLYKIKGVIDSLEMVKKVTNGGNVMLDSQISHAHTAFNRYFVQSNQEINKKMWERLNVVIDNYGKEHGLEMIIGANGAGTLLYADNKRDVTDDLIKYVNQKYEKGN